MKAFFDFIKQLHIAILTYLPGEIGFRARYRFYKDRLKYLGEGARIDIGVLIQGWEHVSIGSNTWIDKYVILLAGAPFKGERRITAKQNIAYNGEPGDLCIGSNCHIAPYVLISGMGGLFIGDNVGIASGSKVYSFSHHYKDISDPSNKEVFKFTPMAPHNQQALIMAPIVICDNCAIGLNSVLLPGATMGENSWLGVCSVLTGKIPANVIAHGNPALSIKER